MNRLKTDVLVIGGGAAGIRAAVEAAAHGVDVTLVGQTPITASGSTFSKLSRGWGIQALMDDEFDSQHIELFYNEILSVGQGYGDPTLARILVEESGRRVNDLINYGIKFKKREDGSYFRAEGCFSKTERALITSDFENVKRSLSSILHQHRVRIVTGMVIDLLVRDHFCTGAFCFILGDKKLSRIDAKATIMAAGGGGGIFEHHLCGVEHTGDGCALAHRAGARLSNMAFIQFMLGLKYKRERQFLPRQMLYQKDVLVDGHGKPVLESYFPDAVQRKRAVDLRQAHCPASTCDASFNIDLAIWQATKETGAVFWNADASAVPQREVVHMAHAFNGGIHIDAGSASTRSGLFAAGETAAGPHGADRIGGCMMTATQVFGRRAGKSAAEFAKRSGCHIDDRRQEHFPIIIKDGNFKDEKDVLDRLEKLVTQAMSAYVSVARWAKGLETCRTILFDAGKRLMTMEGASSENFIRFNRIRNMIDVGEQIVVSAIERKTSMGPHYRVDSKAPSHTDKSERIKDLRT